MDRRYLVPLAVLAALGLGAAAFTTLWAPRGPSPGPDQAYPAGAGPEHVDFSALEASGSNVSHAPRSYWDSYAIVYTAPPERRLVEGDYYVNSTTGEIISERWHDATVYINGSTYAYVQPADSVPEHRREEVESDPAFVYDDATGEYYRYDPHYGRVAPRNVGRHTAILDAYTWAAVDTTTHHGVPVITYRVTGTRTDVADVPPASHGTLQLGVEDGIVYDVTLDADARDYRYTYDVHPAPFPDHGWVDTAREVVSANRSSVRG
ncbi:MAG: hypothetical protein ABEJ23_03805 [Haloarculaceae archaeon]